MNMINKKQFYTNQTSSRWKKVNKMRHFTIIDDLNVSQKNIQYGDLSFFSAYFILVHNTFIMVKNYGFVMGFVILAYNFD